jgi:hypothetical protein
MSDQISYNERIFSKGLRSRLHLARFYWLQDKLKSFPSNDLTVLELGCYDAKTIPFLPVPPKKYLGFDANWENGLDIARKTYQNPNYEFFECTNPDEMIVRGEKFNLVICMETLEHIPDEMLEGYLTKIRDATDGLFILTVPNEIGLVFFIKYLIKLIVFREKINPKYSFSDVMYQTLGWTSRVKHDDHKGFDYRRLVDRLRRDWQIEEVQAIPFNWMPLSMSFSIGIVCRPPV